MHEHINNPEYYKRRIEMTIIPAYGRDYKNKQEVMADFNANKDFIIQDVTSRWDGKPINKSDLTGSVTIRYGNLRKVLIVEVNN